MKSWVFFIMVVATTIAILPIGSRAGIVCDDMRNGAPDLYKLYCSQDGSNTPRPAGASSSFSDSFKISPASLPTENSNYGLEVISTALTSGASPGFPTLSLLKGFHRFGTGISTSAGNTFYSNDLVERIAGPSTLQTLQASEPATGTFTDLNLGTSFLIADPSFGPRIQLGLSARYNHITNTVGGGPALFLGTRYLSFGAGISREQVSNYFSATNFISFLVSSRIGIFELEYNYLTATPVNLPFPLATPLSPIQILTLSFPFHSFIFTAAIRELNYELEGNVVQTHAAVQYFISTHLAIGYLYNYIPGGNSVGAQVYL